MKLVSNFFILVFCCLMVPASFAEHQSPLGYWRTIDDLTGQPKAIIEITKTPKNTLEGRILKIFQQAGYPEKKYCIACLGQKHNKPLIGMIVLEQLKQKQNKPAQWVNGQVLDPKNGKIYNCNLRVAKNGQTLKVRGYIGLPLLGRSQTWERLDKFKS